MFAESGNTFTDNALCTDAETEAAARSVNATPAHPIPGTSFIMTLAFSRNGSPPLNSSRIPDARNSKTEPYLLDENHQPAEDEDTVFPADQRVMFGALLVKREGER